MPTTRVYDRVPYCAVECNDATQTVHCEFASLDAYLRYCREVPAVAGANDSSVSRTSSFAGSDSFDHAEELARYGWKEGRKRMEEFAYRLKTPPAHTEQYRKRVLSVAGGAGFSMGRFLVGDPACMYRYKTHTRQGQRILSVCVNIGVSFDVFADSIIRKGAAILSLCERLEADGYGLEIFVCFAELDTMTVSVRVLVKPAGEPFDAGYLAYPLAHPSMFRRQGFRVLENETEYGASGMTWRGYGSPFDAEESKRGIDVYIPTSYAYQFDTDDSARLWVQETLDRLGIGEKGGE